MSTHDAAHLRLAGVTRLSLAGGRGPTDAFVFDPHRLAWPCWSLAVGEGPAPLLVTFDRHLDLVPPRTPERIPRRDAGLRAIDEYARWELDVRNFDHVLAAMESGCIGDALVFGRAHPPNAFAGGVWTDSHGHPHRVQVVPTVDRLAERYGEPGASPETEEAEAMIRRAGATLLDVDLDCFTSPSDADPTTVIPWPLELIREHLMPRGSERFWDAVLQRCVALTFAREPPHCGGLIATGKLFAEVSQVLFVELLGAGPP